MLEPRAPLTRDALAALMAASGLPLSADEIDALLRPTATIYAAVDDLDGLDLGEIESAAVFQLPGE